MYGDKEDGQFIHMFGTEEETCQAVGCVPLTDVPGDLNFAAVCQ